MVFVRYFLSFNVMVVSGFEYPQSVTRVRLAKQSF